MKKARIYQTDFKTHYNYNFFVEKTPTTGDSFLDLVAFDGIEELFCNLTPYKGKVPIVIDEGGGAISIVFIFSKQGDSFIKRQKESGKITTVKRVAIASPVYYVKEPSYIDNEFDLGRDTYKATFDAQGNILTEVENIIVWNAAIAPMTYVLVKDYATSGLIDVDRTKATGKCMAVAGKSFICEAVNISLGGTQEVVERSTSRREPEEIQANELIYGKYEII